MKKMKKILVVLAVVFLTTISYSQPSGRASTFSLGIFGGINIPRLSGGSGYELSRDFTSRAGAAFGITSSVYVGSNFTLRLDFMYSSEGGKRNGVQAFDASTLNPLVPSGTYFYADYNNESILNYFEVPLLLKYSFPLGKSTKFYVDLGPYAGVLLNAKQKTKGSSLIYADRGETQVVVPVAQPFDANTDVTSDIKSFNAGVTAGGGISQNFGSGELFVDLRGAYGITSIQKDKKNGSSHTGNLLFDIGYAFHF
jgi:hypothetical protein